MKSACRRTYDAVAPHYDQGMRPLDRWLLGRLREKTLSELPQVGRILEIGAGTGRNFIYYPEEASGVATEPSPEMLKIAAGKTRPRSVHLIQSGAEQIPFKNDSFHAAFATLVFCSVESPQKGFAEIRRVVGSGGKVVLLEHVRPGGLLGVLSDILNLITAPLFGDHVNRRTAREAEAAGLTVERVEKRLLGIINLIVCRV